MKYLFPMATALVLIATTLGSFNALAGQRASSSDLKTFSCSVTGYTIYNQDGKDIANSYDPLKITLNAENPKSAVSAVQAAVGMTSVGLSIGMVDEYVVDLSKLDVTCIEK